MYMHVNIGSVCRMKEMAYLEYMMGNNPICGDSERGGHRRASTAQSSSAFSQHYKKLITRLHKAIIFQRHIF